MSPQLVVSVSTVLYLISFDAEGDSWAGGNEAICLFDDKRPWIASTDWSDPLSSSGRS